MSELEQVPAQSVTKNGRVACIVTSWCLLNDSSVSSSDIFLLSWHTGTVHGTAKDCRFYVPSTTIVWPSQG